MIGLDYNELARALIGEGLAAAIAAQMAPAPPEALLTKAELAGRWNVTPPTIDRMVRAGMPVEYVTPDAPRFDRAACDAWRKARPAPVRTAKVTAPTVAPVTLDGVRMLGRKR
jgi:hypothetical protein